MIRTGSFRDRKRSLEARRSDGAELVPSKHFQPSSDKTSASIQTPEAMFSDQSVLDEIDLHFKRSLAKKRNQQPLPQGTSLPTKKQEPGEPSSLRTILPKPSSSEAHQIIVADNPIVATTKSDLQKAAVSPHQISTSTKLQSFPNVARTAIVSTPRGTQAASISTVSAVSSSQPESISSSATTCTTCDVKAMPNTNATVHHCVTTSPSSQQTTKKQHERGDTPSTVDVATSSQPTVLAGSGAKATSFVPQPPLLPLLDLYNAAGSSVVLFPGGLPVQIPTQSFVLVNPNEIPQTASIIAPSKTVAGSCNLVGVGGSVNAVSNPVPGGYIVLPPTTSHSNTMSLTATEVGISNQQRMSVPTTPTTPTVQTTNTCVSKEITQETADTSILKSPASVEDHFAKALGEQWSRVKKTGAMQNTVAS